jgi:ABC-2 type transport system ATP-binding protein
MSLEGESQERCQSMLQFNRVTKDYESTRAVDELTFEVRGGEIFGLLGPNGAGKTTTVSLACGLTKPDRGEVTLTGVGPPSERRVRRHVGVAPQALALYEDLTGEENLRFFGRLQGLRGHTLKERLRWCLDFAELTDRRHEQVSRWSGGMKRRLNLAVAMIHDPCVLLLDEPTVGVDPQSRNAILERIAQLRDEGRAVVYTTHYMEEASRLCDRVGIIDRGRLLSIDTVDGLISSHGGPMQVMAETVEGKVFVETSEPVATLAELSANSELVSFHVERPSLESVFLHLTGRSLRD